MRWMVLLVLLVGCRTSPEEAMERDEGYPVALYYKGEPAPRGEYEVVKELRVTCAKTMSWNQSPPPEAVEAMLRTAARKVEADAVIDVEISKVHVGLSSWGERDGKGKAIRYTAGR